MAEEIVLWRRLDRPGHEAARLVFHAPLWQLTGTAVFGEAAGPAAGVPRRVRPRVEHLACAGRRLARLPAHQVRGAGRRGPPVAPERPSLSGGGRMRRLDLAFSPATNLLALRRLSLEPGRPPR